MLRGEIRLADLDDAWQRSAAGPQAEQVRSIAVERLGAVVGRAPAEVMAQLDDALRLHLQL